MFSDHSHCRQKGQHIENNPPAQRANLRFRSKLMSCERAWTVIRGGWLKHVSSGPAERAAEVPDLFWSTATDAPGAAEKKFESKVLEERFVGGRPTDGERPRARTSQEAAAAGETERGGQGGGWRWEATVQNKEDEPLSSAVSWSVTSLSVLTLPSVWSLTRELLPLSELWRRWRSDLAGIASHQDCCWPVCFCVSRTLNNIPLMSERIRPPWPPSVHNPFLAFDSRTVKTIFLFES